MNAKKILSLMKTAKKNYIQEPDKFNQFLQNRQIIPFENLVNVSRQNNFVNNSSQNQNINEDNFSNNNSNDYNNFENNRTSNLLEEIADNTSSIRNINSNQQLPQANYPQSNPYPQPMINYPQGQMNPNMPINVISKNYISQNSFADEEDEEIVEETKSIKLAKIPDKLLKESATDWEPINYRGVDDKYDLFGMSRVEIKFDEIEQKLLYKIIEPVLTEDEQKNLTELKQAFIYVFEKYSPEFIDISGKDFIITGAKKLAEKYRIKLSPEEFEKITYFLARDFLGLEMIEPIMHDPFIEDVSCDGLNVPIFVNHLKYGPLEVNRSYDDPEKLNSFIIKLAQKSNQEISLSKPILQGALTDGSRVEAIYGKEISEKGSSYTIRKFREEPFTPIHLIEFGTMPPFLLAYLWLAVENKQSLLVSGGTATGKTTILNALSLFAPPTSKIVSIEDTPEINLPHEHWLSLVARESDGKAEVSMFDLLKASLRERPDYIIVGEIRGKEAAILFQGMATGHAGLGTVHAEKFQDLVNRMTIEPINMPKQLLTELKLVLFQKQVKVKNNVVRRTSSVVEIIDYNSKTDKFQINEFLHYNPAEDTFTFKENSAIISHLITLRGGKEEALWTEIEKRRRILDTMHKSRILEFKDVADVIRAYFKDPANIFEYISKYTNKQPTKK